MLYSEGDLTEEQAQKIVGEKMIARINAINNFLKKNDFTLFYHGTTMDVVEQIWESKRLWHPTNTQFPTREEILKTTSISENELISSRRLRKKNQNNLIN